MRRTPRLLISAVAVLGFIGASCGSDDDDPAATVAPTAAPVVTDAPTTDAPEHAVTGDVTVFAAASLTAAFTEIGDAFMVEYPDAKVTFNFASSSDLVTQINEGAPADVYASADQANMTKLTDAAGNAGDPAVFATNSLQIIVSKGNPKGITGVADLANPDLIYVTCAPEVPIGKYGAQVLTNAGVTVTPKSLEENVKGIVTKVTLGEADAGIVYTTDVLAAGDQAEGVDIPTDINVIATYPMVVTKAAPNAVGAQAFEDFVLSAQGQKILGTYGFKAP
ncbi:MAG: molybdenum transporter, periplasmic molybdate-binding protein [Ilumatobacteraceae bacterium]|nr:molybdenum transporter, periplasmic molybdate-binding protein [Ilumatobacteraceae bacterium]